jgi:hypothetical protein
MRSGANGRSKLELKMCDDESSEPSINKNYAALAFYVKPKRRQMISFSRLPRPLLIASHERAPRNDDVVEKQNRK